MDREKSLGQGEILEKSRYIAEFREIFGEDG
jgi:hypothetical protein